MRAEAAERSNLVFGPLCLILIFDPGGTKLSVFLSGREDAKARVLDEPLPPFLRKGKRSLESQTQTESQMQTHPPKATTLWTM